MPPPLRPGASPEELGVVVSLQLPVQLSETYLLHETSSSLDLKVQVPRPPTHEQSNSPAELAFCLAEVEFGEKHSAAIPSSAIARGILMANSIVPEGDPAPLCDKLRASYLAMQQRPLDV